MQKKMVIGFVTLGLRFDGDTIKKQGLGGSETALTCVSRELSKLGHRVAVFCECSAPGNYDGVDYYHHENFGKISSVTRWDALISSRWPEFLKGNSFAGLRVLWLHDTLTDQKRLMTSTWQTDMLMLLSDFHIRNYTEGKSEEETNEKKVPWLKPLMWRTSNGIDMEQIEANRRPKVPGKLIYTSRPERGLHFLLNGVFPELLKEFPNLKLHYCNYSLQGMKVPTQVAQIIALSEQMAKKYPNNVVNMGHLTKDRLYQEMSSAELLLYPTSFPEISPVRGDTEIETLGGKFKIKDLVGKKDFKVYSCGESGQLSISTVRGVFLTRKKAKMLRLRVRPGRGRNARKEKSLYLTPDHEVMLIDGSYIRADELKPGDRLKAFRRQKNDWAKGYDSIGLTGTQTIPEHRFVAQKKLGRKLKKGEVVDHLDSDTHNNTFENLKVWPSHSAHMKNHLERMSDEERRTLLEKRAGYLHAWHASMTEEELSKVKADAANAGWGPGKLIEFNGKTQTCAEWARELGFSYSSLKYRLNNWTLEDALTPGTQKEHWKRVGSKKRKKPAGNHIVVAIESAKNADAYCMEVEPDHNFVANGLVVHNCITAMEAAACKTPIVSTDDFALSETVANNRTGYLIQGTPEKKNKEYFAKFNRKALMLLRNEGLRTQMGEEGPKWIEEQGYTWAAVAKSWEQKFYEEMEKRWSGNDRKIITELQRNSDIMMARELAADHEDLHSALSKQIEETLSPKKPETDEEIKNAFAEAIPRFDKLAQLMAVTGVDPTVVWDFACGDTAFGLYMAQASKKVTSYCIDKDHEVLARVSAYASQEKLNLTERVKTRKADALVGSNLDLPKPNLIHLGDILDVVEKPHELLQDAVDILDPGSWITFTTRFGAQAALPQTTHDRVWNFEQQDFYEMFGQGFKGQLTFSEEGISNGGDLQGHWIGILPVPDKRIEIKQLEPERRRRVIRPYQSLGCAMIGRNVENWANATLKPLLDITDKIVVALDDRTDDHSEELIRRLDPEEKKIEIRSVTFEDFSQIRNASKEGIDTDWLLWVDFDEVMSEPLKLRKYLRSASFNGFSIKQCHLMLDVHGTFDIPVRLLRNKPHYKFVGCIHEHCLDVSGGDFDTPIKPSMLVNDVDLAHYGYLHEKQRRLKCSNRNMALLKKDIEVYGKGGRKLTWVLVIRDYLNIVKWAAEKKGLHKTGIKRGSNEHNLCEMAIKTFFQHFSDPKSKYYGLVFPMYQEALGLLGISGIPFEDRAAPPFSVALGLAAAMGGPANDEVKAKIRWFVDEIEFLEFMDQQSKQMLQELGVVKEKHYAADLEKPSEVVFDYSQEKAEALLGAGINVIHEQTGRLM